MLPCLSASFEALEHRHLLAAVVWTGGAGTLNWSDSGNWDRGGFAAVPQNGDDVTIPNLGDPGINGDVTIQFNSVVDLNSLTSEESILTTGGSLTLSGASQINGTLTLDAGALNANAAFSLSNEFDWTGGSLTGAGPVEILAGAKMDITGTGTHVIGDTRIVGDGQVNWDDGVLEWVPSPTPTEPLFDVALFDIFGASEKRLHFVRLRNAGSMRLRGTGGLRSANFAGTAVGSALVNEVDGSVQVQGDFTLVSETTPNVFENSRQVDVQAGTFTITGTSSIVGNSVWNDGSTIIGPGQVEFAMGTADVLGAVTAENLGLSGAVLDVQGNLTVTDEFDWTAGSFVGSGVTTLVAGSEMNISDTATRIIGDIQVEGAGQVNWTEGTIERFPSPVASEPLFDVALFDVFGNSEKELHGVRLRNAGLMRLRGTGGLRSDNFGGTALGSTLVNEVGGNIQVQSDFTLISETTPNVFENSGEVDVQAGTFTITGISSNHGNSVWNNGSTIVGPGHVELAMGTADVLGAVTKENVRISGAELDVQGNLTVTDEFDWTGGSFVGAGITTLVAGAEMNIRGTSTRFIGDTQVQGAGQVNWTEGTIQRLPSPVASQPLFDVSLFDVFGNAEKELHGVRLRNAGLMRLGGTGGLRSDNFGGTALGSTLVNEVGGEIQVQSDFTLVSETTPNVFENWGEVDVQVGTFTITGISSINGNSVWNNGSTIVGPGHVDLAMGTADILGAVTAENLRLSGAALDVQGNLTVTDEFDWTGGSFIGAGLTTLVAGAEMNIRGTATRIIGDIQVDGAGQVNWTEGTLERVPSPAISQPLFDVALFDIFGNSEKELHGVRLRNAGLMLLRGTGGLRSDNFGGTGVGSTVMNEVSGIIQVQGDFTLVSETTPTVFENSGTLDVQAGTFTVTSFSQLQGLTELDSGGIVVPVFDMNGGSLIGNGTVTGDVSSDGGLDPGTQSAVIGAISIDGNYVQSSLGALVYDIDGGQSDQLTVNGTVVLAGALQVQVQSEPPTGVELTVISNDDTDNVVGIFDQLPEGELFFSNGGNSQFQISYAGGTGNDVILNPQEVSDLVSIRLETTDLLGAPISSISSGGSFLVRGFVEDLRPLPTGVLAAYMDVIYDAPLVSARGPISYGLDYPLGRSGDLSSAGLIDEIGAFDGITPLGGGEFLLFSVPFTADASGVATFAADPADLLPAHDVLVYGTNQPVPSSQIDYGTTSIEVIDSTVNNPPVFVNVEATPMIDEGQAVTVQGTFFDADPADTFTVVIDWNASGNPGGPGEGSTTISQAELVDLGNGNWSFTAMHPYLDDNPTATSVDNYTINVTVADDTGDSDVEGVVTQVKNVAPQIEHLAIDGPGTLDNKAMPGELISVSALFSDLGLLDQHTVIVDWGESSSDDLEDTSDSSDPLDTTIDCDCNGGGSGSATATHEYSSGGIFTITVTVIDDDTGEVSDATTQVFVTGVEVLEGVLYVIGTDGADHVTINKQGNGRLKLHADFLPHGNFITIDTNTTPVHEIVAYLCAGDDHMTIAGNIDQPSIIHGGAGNDHLNAGGGTTVLLGDSGDDHLNGGSSRDILIGGLGFDRLVGGRGDDVLIGGTTSDDDDEQLRNLLALWNRHEEYGQRVAAIDLALTVIDDGDTDRLTGSSGRDLFYNGSGDELTDLKTKRRPEALLG